VTEEELMKISPAAVLAQRLMEQGTSLEETLSGFRQDHPEVEIDSNVPFVNPNPDPAFPDRPDHQDFRVLSRIIQQMDYDGEHNEDQNVVESLIPSGVDVESVIYMAKQRARRGEELFTKEASFYSKAVIMWLDAFTAGVKFGRERAIKMVLDDSIDNGSRRTGGV
jgi:hypothetical protein